MLTAACSTPHPARPAPSHSTGTSPEFELALYTMCFLCSEEEKTFLEIGPYDLNIVCYRIRSKYGDKVR
jgi:poly(U)-specific endoribonuclease